jgi:DnaJ homolog subfamily A member 2
MGGRRGGQKAKRKTKSVLHNLKVTLEDVYIGKNKYLEISRYRTCQTCKGSGSKDPNANTKCQGCGGKGMKTVIRQMGNAILQQTVNCTDCKGEGFAIKDKDKCKACNGQKSVQEKKTLEVHIDKGAADGKRYIFSGESDEFPEYEPGDVVVEIQVEKHKRFIRKGADLVYNAEITLVEALCGYEIVIEHLDKRKVLVKSKPGEIIKPGELKTVKELGLPFFETPYKYGNLYINFEFIFPDKVDQKQAKILMEVI